MEMKSMCTLSMAVLVSLMVWVPISESEAASSSLFVERFREQSGFFAPETVPSHFGKVSADSDLIFQTSNAGFAESERRNIQPRRISGFSIINFPPFEGLPGSQSHVVTTSGPETTVQDPFTLSPSVTFANLVERARQRSTTVSADPTSSDPTEASTTTTTTTRPTTSSYTFDSGHLPGRTVLRSRSRFQSQAFNPNKARLQQVRLTSQQRHQLVQLHKNANRINRRQRVRTTESTTTSTTIFEPTTESVSTKEETTSTVAPATTVSFPRIFTNIETASALLVTRNVTSTNVVTSDMFQESTTETTMPSRKLRQNEDSHLSTYDYYYYETTPPVYYDYYEAETTLKPKLETPTPTTTTTTTSTTTATTTTTTTTTTMTTTTTSSTTTSTTTTPTTITTTPSTISTTMIPSEATTMLNDEYSTEMFSDRSPRTSDVDVWESEHDQHLDEESPNIFSGLYHEVNPGQYNEINPGQYHEQHPGQYHEHHPGQYNDPLLDEGQYREENPGQYKEPLDVQVVEIKHTDDAQVYNVQSKVENFIIGEYGTISKSSGQTIQGVRYTALDDSVDPNLIYETLKKFFPMSQQSENEDET